VAPVGFAGVVANSLRAKGEPLVVKVSTALRIIGLVLLVALAIPAFAQWAPVGPEGGDVRALAYDPKNPDRILLGTSAGQLFQSTDRGNTWSRYADLGREDYVLDNIAFDPTDSKIVYIAAWTMDTVNDGDIFKSKDGGKSWSKLAAMRGKSVRALELAPSDSKILVAGALDGVWRSTDRGDSWQRISPAGHADIKNIESIAIDPRDANVIYAGTWHLPWKTADGGASWKNIKNGVIDDSDVFSIIIDHANPATVFASACSGIYRSETSGDLFRKITGIPSTARRTRVLMQDPVNPSVVYAGTTEGLWKSTDNGKTYTMVTPGKYIVNDVMIDPRNPQRILVATDRSGVIASEDGMRTFKASNAGFSHRQVYSIAVDRNDANTVYVGMINDKEWGGVFVSHNTGSSWSQLSEGLGGRDVFDITQAKSGALVAATNRGVYRLDANARQWTPINAVIREIPRPAPKALRVKGKLVTPKPLPPTIVKSQIENRVSAVETKGSKWWAATSNGLFATSNEGREWKGGAVLGQTEFVSVRSLGDVVVAATPRNLFLSSDSGATWQQTKAPYFLTRIYGAAISSDSKIWIATREGAYYSTDQGATWTHAMEGLPSKNVLRIDADGDRLLATAYGARSIFESRDNGHSWRMTPDTGLSIRTAALLHGKVIAASSYNGVLVQRDGNQRASEGHVITAEKTKNGGGAE
jgi:photosystem II stability/assembly factor-like uncharacterized protein